MSNKFELPVSGFTNGLNTDASVLNVLPSELMSGTINVDLLNNATIKRRRGIDFLGVTDTGQHLSDVRLADVIDDSNQEVITAVYVSLTAPNGSKVERVVADIDNQFWVYEYTFNSLVDFANPLQKISRTGKSSSLQKYYPVKYDVSDDKLFCVGRNLHPCFLKVGTDNSTLEVTYLDVRCRVKPDQQSAAGSRVKRTVGGITYLYECLLTHTSDFANRPHDGVGDWQNFWQKVDAPIPASGIGSVDWNFGVAYTSYMDRRYNSRATVSEASTFPTSVAFFGGRLWLGFDPKYPNEILFSQVISGDDSVNRFHQAADPYNIDDPDLVDSDGGVIRTPSSGTGLELLAQNASLFVSTTKGIRQISGSDGTFKATSFTNEEILKEDILSPYSMVAISDYLLVFGDSNIWKSQRSQDTLFTTRTSFNPVIDNKISTLWKAIPRKCKETAFLQYNRSERVVYYWYNDSLKDFSKLSNGYNQIGYFTSLLKFNNNTLDTVGAEGTKRSASDTFTVHTYPDVGLLNKPYIAYALTAPALSEVDERVYVDDVLVTVGTNAVTTSIDAVVDTPLTNYIIAIKRQVSSPQVTTQAAFAKLNGVAPVDWASASEYKTSFISKAITGISTLGSLSKVKSMMYIYVILERLLETAVSTSDTMDSTTITVDSDLLTVDANSFFAIRGGCLMRIASQFSIGSQNAKYSAAKQIYFPDRWPYAQIDNQSDGFNHTWYKHRVRSRGNVFQIILENDGDKDFHVIGWANNFSQ